MTPDTSTEPPLDAIDLPADLAETIRRVGDRAEPPATLAEGFDVFETVLDDQAVVLDLSDMYQTHQTRHVVAFDATVEYVPCVLDAVIAALVVDAEPVRIRSAPPTGGPTVDIEVTDGSATVRPESAVASFGVAHEDATGDVTTVQTSLEEPSTIPATCTFINAFPDRVTYETWAAEVEAASVMPLEIPELRSVAHHGAERYRRP